MARKTGQSVAIRAEQHVISSYSGPLPPAKEMMIYAQVHPDFPERMMRMAEKEQDFRHKYNQSLVVRAQTFTAIIVLAALFLSGWMASHGNATTGAVIAIGGIVTAAVASLWGRAQNKSLG